MANPFPLSCFNAVDTHDYTCSVGGIIALTSRFGGIHRNFQQAGYQFPLDSTKGTDWTPIGPTQTHFNQTADCRPMRVWSASLLKLNDSDAI